MLQNIKLTIEFDGTNYCGWLRQGNENIPTVQETIEQAILKLTGQNIEVTGCSRTDAGVHAINYAANFNINTQIPAESFYKALNQFLPDDIKISKSEAVSSDFHAVYSAVRKTYRYYFYISENIKPLYKNRAWNFAKKSDLSSGQILDLANRACGSFLGYHDFSAFKAAGGLAKTSCRTIFYANVKSISENVFYLEICGDGFLYNMVRIIAGTIADLIKGRFSCDDISIILESKDRKKAGVTAPPHGLYLYKVDY